MGRVSRRALLASGATLVASTIVSPPAEAKQGKPKESTTPKLIVRVRDEIRYDLDPDIPFLGLHTSVVALDGNGVSTSIPLTTTHPRLLLRAIVREALRAAEENFGLTDIDKDEVLVFGLPVPGSLGPWGVL
jgi:hypothetical protein